MTRALRRAGTLLLLAVAAWHGGRAAWIAGKARLAQHLVRDAWGKTLAGAGDAPPWPWADTHPVARLIVPGRGVDVFVLAGASGRTMAFGPGHLSGTPRPGEPGNSVVSGHRDTHFAFLRRLRDGDAIVVERRDGRRRRYVVDGARVVDHRETWVAPRRGGHAAHPRDLLPVRRPAARRPAAVRGDRAPGRGAGRPGRELYGPFPSPHPARRVPHGGGLMERNCPRRRALSMIGLAAAGAACGKGGSGVQTADPVGPTPAYARFTDELHDLLTGSPIASGRIVFSDHPPIEVRDGRYTVSESHQLEVGTVHPNVRIEASGCVPRRTSVVVQADGLRVDLGYKRAPLDLISDEGLYEQWLETRQGRILERWDPALYRGAILYDRQLFRYDGTKPVLYATDYDTHPSFVPSVQEIAGAEIAAMTGGALRDGVRLASQLPRSEWPMVPDARGWLLFYTLLGYFDRQSFSILSAPLRGRFRHRARGNPVPAAGPCDEPGGDPREDTRGDRRLQERLRSAHARVARGGLRHDPVPPEDRPARHRRSGRPGLTPERLRAGRDGGSRAGSSLARSARHPPR